MQTEETDSINQGGRPTKYRSAFNKQAKMLCLLGGTDKQIAKFFEISEVTLNQWKKDYPGFLKSLSGGKIIADATVASALFKRAIGYRYTETTFEKVDTKKVLQETSESEIAKDVYKRKVVVKELPPDVGAATLWLKNRQREIWRDKEFDYSKLSDEQLESIIDGLRQQHQNNRL